MCLLEFLNYTEIESSLCPDPAKFLLFWRTVNNLFVQYIRIQVFRMSPEQLDSYSGGAGGLRHGGAPREDRLLPRPQC